MESPSTPPRSVKVDKAQKRYWDSIWATGEIPAAVDPRVRGLRTYVKRRFHEYFRSVFSGMETRGAKLLEIGCARSAWLPYFAKEFEFEISGLDYSEIGCEQERKILANADVRGEVVCADLFSPPEWMVGAFDVVVSFGVVEHFEDTAACIAAFSEFLKPGGIVVTIIPNMTALIGLVQKVVNRPVFDIHVPLDSPALFAAHRLVGLEVCDCRYFLSANFGVSNLTGIQPGSLAWFVKRMALLSLVALSAGVWFVEEKIGAFKANKMTSPYVICVAQKPGGSETRGKRNEIDSEDNQ